MFGMITAVGLSNLQFVDLNSTRNLFVLGFSFFFSLALPQWIKNHRDIELTTVPELDQIIKVLLETSMFVGGILGFILDNTIPGTKEERGIIAWENQHIQHQKQEDSQNSGDTYDIPFITGILRRYKWTQYVPFLPTFLDKTREKQTEI